VPHQSFRQVTETPPQYDNTHRHQWFRAHGAPRFSRGLGLAGARVVHLNEIGGDGETSAHLLYFDSGRWNDEVRGAGGE
jgi:hypothetical protein